MINQFRTLLINLPDQGVPTEHIPTGFAARVLTGELLNFYNLLFPATLDRNQKLLLGQAYLELVTSAGLDEVFVISDSRITYDLQTDFNNFKSSSLNLTRLYNLIASNTTIVQQMLSTKQLDNKKYDNLWFFHHNPVYKLAGLISAYVLRLT